MKNQKTITTAQKLINENDEDSLDRRADLLTDDIDQDFENECTTWNFEDGSFLKMNGDFSIEVG